MPDPISPAGSPTAVVPPQVTAAMLTKTSAAHPTKLNSGPALTSTKRESDRAVAIMVTERFKSEVPAVAGLVGRQACVWPDASP